jgi:iron complex transport system substrate-binding protein
MTPFGFRAFSGPFEQLGTEEFTALGWALVVVSAMDVVDGVLLWQRRRWGARLGVATTPFAFALGIGFALPFMLLMVPNPTGARARQPARVSLASPSTTDPRTGLWLRSCRRVRPARGYAESVRIVSLLPSATEIIARLGLADSLVGRSNECTYPPEVLDRPVVTAARIDPRKLDSVEIDRQVREAIADGRSLYVVDAALIDRLAPDVIVTQDLCAVCAVSSGELASACLVGARVISLDPSTLDEVAASIETLAAALGVRERGREVAGAMRATIDDVRRSTRAALDAGAHRPRVFVAEWIDPPFVPGHWLPDMIAAAGGEPLLAEPGRPSHPTTWDDVAAQDPELLVIAACGFDADEAARRAAHLDLERIAPNVRVVVVDGDAYYSRPGPRLADGVRQLGHMLHPEAVSDPALPRIELDNVPSTARAVYRRIL